MEAGLLDPTTIMTTMTMTTTETMIITMITMMIMMTRTILKRKQSPTSIPQTPLSTSHPPLLPPTSPPSYQEL